VRGLERSDNEDPSNARANRTNHPIGPHPTRGLIDVVSGVGVCFVCCVDALTRPGLGLEVFSSRVSVYVVAVVVFVGGVVYARSKKCESVI